MIQEGEIKIRAAEPADAAAVLACLAAAFAPHRDLYTPGAYADTTLDSSTILNRMDEMHVLVAVRLADGKVVGTIASASVDGASDEQEGSRREGHVRGMAVLPEVQGSGTAKRLLNLAEESLRNDGCTHVTLDTTEPLQRAIRFYENHGYRPSGQVRDFCGMNLIEYEKRLL